MKRRIITMMCICLLSAGCGTNKEYSMAAGDGEETENILENTESILEGSETLDSMSPITETESEVTGEYDFTLCFAGDISLDEKAVTTAKLDAAGGELSECVSPELLGIMQNADLMCLNNEFTYSENGSPMEGKMYTFRANP